MTSLSLQSRAILRQMILETGVVVRTVATDENDRHPERGIVAGVIAGIGIGIDSEVEAEIEIEVEIGNEIETAVEAEEEIGIEVGGEIAGAEAIVGTEKIPGVDGIN